MKILTIFGTRPEAIKMAPVIQALKSHEDFQVKICVTAQHRHMLDQMLALFQITPDYDLDIMSSNQDLFDVTNETLSKLRQILQQEKPNLVLVLGDTTSAFAGALAAFYLRIPVAHVEAGLRTGDLNAPFPEEANRILITRLADLHFAHTEVAKFNLMSEAIPETKIFVTGNTVIDALLWVKDHIHWQSAWKDLFASAVSPLQKQQPIILVTAHRRESFGQGFVGICAGLASIAERYPDWHIIYPVHLNPNVKLIVEEKLGHYKNVHLLKPLDYAPFVYLMNQARFILTDSGGIQEEAPALLKPVLVMREKTERPEAIAAGVAMLVGTNPERILTAVETLMTDMSQYTKMTTAKNPYGDGRAAQRIVAVLQSYFAKRTPQEKISEVSV